MLGYFVPRDWCLHDFYFWTLLWNSNLLRSRTLLIGGSLMSDSLNNKRVLSELISSPWLLASWILFSNLPMKLKLNKLEGRCWQVGPCCQNQWTRIVCYLDLFSSPWMLAIGFYFEPTREIRTCQGRGRCWRNGSPMLESVMRMMRTPWRRRWSPISGFHQDEDWYARMTYDM
jgi:hypothetical protein